MYSDRLARIAAIKADPDALATEEATRKEQLNNAMLELIRRTFYHKEGNLLFARNIRAYEPLIAAAQASGNEKLAEQLTSAQSHAVEAYRDWRQSANRAQSSQDRFVDGLVAQNIADAIGPTYRGVHGIEREVVEAVQEEARKAAKSHVDLLTGARNRDLRHNEPWLEGFGLELDRDVALAHIGSAFEMFKAWTPLAAEDPVFQQRLLSNLKGVGQATVDGVEGLYSMGLSGYQLVGRSNLLAGELLLEGAGDALGMDVNPLGTETINDMLALEDALRNFDTTEIRDAIIRAPDAINRRFEQLAGQGEKGIQSALYTTGYATAAGLGAEEAAILAAFRLPRVIRNARTATPELPRVPNNISPDDTTRLNDSRLGELGNRDTTVAAGDRTKTLDPGPGQTGTVTNTARGGEIVVREPTEPYTNPPNFGRDAPGGGSADQSAGTILNVGRRIGDDVPYAATPRVRLKMFNSDLDLPSGTAILDETGAVIAYVGEKLGQGGGSVVYRQVDAAGRPIGNVIKMGHGTTSTPYFDMVDRIGRQHGEFAAANATYFSLTEQRQVYRTDGPGNFLSIEQDVATVNAELPGRDPTHRTARSRFGKFENGLFDGESQPTLPQYVTMALAIREMNRKGLVWTDHKLINFDIVRSNSPTGYEMVMGLA